MKHAAILLAGGSGSRMGDAVDDKVLAAIGGRPVFAHVVRAFVASATQDALVVVARDAAQQRQLAAILEREGVALPVQFTLGGRERSDSVRAGLARLPAEAEWVTIHDCARPAVKAAALADVRKTLLALNCAVSLAHRVTDTIRQFAGDPLAAPARGRLLPRGQLWAMETPQAFPRALIERAHARLGQPVTDDLAAVEALGEPVVLVESRFPNPKLTRPADLPLLESLLAPQPMNAPPVHPFRVGYGYDIHRLQDGLPLVLGGIRVPSPAGLVGHSDADVLSHAIADAILGGCGLPDIGHYFPNTDASIAGISSQAILKRAVEEARGRGFAPVNVDATLIAEQPRIAPHIGAMKARLAETLGIPAADIGIKATTQERIGALGQGAGIAAHAVAALAAIPGQAAQA